MIIARDIHVEVETRLVERPAIVALLVESVERVLGEQRELGRVESFTVRVFPASVRAVA